MLHRLLAEAVVGEVLLAGGGEGEVRRRDCEFPGAGFGADAAVALPGGGARDVEGAGEGDEGAMAGAGVGFRGHLF